MNLNIRSIALAVLLCLFQVTCASKVITATDKNFNDIVVNSGKHSLVKFYADWCGHCKKMAPAYEELAESFANADNVQIVEINGDQNRKINSRYDIEGFPTLMLFKKENVKDPVEYKGGRDLDSLQSFVTAHTGVRPKQKKTNHITEVTHYDDTNFEQEVIEDSRAHFTVFTSNSCGHCKNLKPAWFELANLLANDNDTVVISEILVSTTPADHLKKKYEVRGFPTILYFDPKDKSKPEVYSGSRSVESLLEFVNEKTGLYRGIDGSLTEKAGLIKNFDVTGIISSDEKIKRAKELLQALEEHVSIPDAVYYKKLLNKIVSDEVEFFEKESARLTKILSKAGNLTQQKIDSMRKRLNIINQFLKKQITTDNSHDEL